jgi:hypothetical protein
MNTRRNYQPLLALLVLILVSLACGPQKTIVVGGDVTCNLHGIGYGLVYRCICPIDGSSSNDGDFTRGELQTYDSSIIRSEACTDYYHQLSQNNNAQPAATEPPTEAPAPTEPPTDPAPLKPLLTGNFTTCDNVARYVNFTLADDAPPYDPAHVQVLFNDQPATCTPAASNSKILSCNYPPAPYGPPATIQVLIDGQSVNEFNFDGGTICDPVPAPNPAGTEDPNDSAPPTEAPTEDPFTSG